MAATNEPEVLVRNGEITGTPIYQVRGQAHWHSSPKIARDVWRREQAFIAKGGWKATKK
jgi:hypothetical protein